MRDRYLPGSCGLVTASETARVHRNTVTRKSVVVYSTLMTQNGLELPGSGRSRWATNHLVTQQKIRNNRTYPDLWVVNPLVAGSSPARPTHKPQFMTISSQSIVVICSISLSADSPQNDIVGW